MVERIRRAGAIIIGKTNVPEFGLGSQTYNPVFGTTLNAYDQSKTCGGSSGGAAVALALRMVPVADGSDNGGSLRNPAAFNNVFGFRTSFGRVPSHVQRGLHAVDFGARPDGADGAGPRDVAVGDRRIRRAHAAFDSRRIPPSSRGRSSATSKARASDGSATSADTSRSIPACSNYAKARSRYSSRSDASWKPRCPTIQSSRYGAAGARFERGRSRSSSSVPYADPAKRALMKPELQWEIENGLKIGAFEIARRERGAHGVVPGGAQRSSRSTIS